VTDRGRQSRAIEAIRLSSRREGRASAAHDGGQPARTGISGHAGRVRALHRFLQLRRRARRESAFARKEEVARWRSDHRARHARHRTGSPNVTGLPDLQLKGISSCLAELNHPRGCLITSRCGPTILRHSRLPGSRAGSEAGLSAAFSFPGYCLYVDGEPVVHLIRSRVVRRSKRVDMIDHVAFGLPI